MREDPSGKDFGTRYLEDASKVFDHNAWDNIPWDESMEEEARRIVERQKQLALPEDRVHDLLAEPSLHWDNFYSQHSDRFFMNRNWLAKEFPELDMSLATEPMTALEVGCGVGNTTFPILELDKEHRLFLYSCDYSAKAIEVLRSSERYDETRCKAFVWDITQPPPSDCVPPASIDILVCIYVLSAIDPTLIPATLLHLLSLLRPGGCILLKDYGRYDLTQLRFKRDRYIRENLYCRGDGTLVYFFDSEELDKRLCEAGFVKEANVVDRRLIVNRAKKVKMQRVWLQAKYRKPAV